MPLMHPSEDVLVYLALLLVGVYFVVYSFLVSRGYLDVYFSLPDSLLAYLSLLLF